MSVSFEAMRSKCPRVNSSADTFFCVRRFRISPIVKDVNSIARRCGACPARRAQQSAPLQACEGAARTPESLPFDHAGHLEVASVLLRSIPQRLLAREGLAGLIRSQRRILGAAEGDLRHGFDLGGIQFV